MEPGGGQGGRRKEGDSENNHRESDEDEDEGSLCRTELKSVSVALPEEKDSRLLLEILQSFFLFISSKLCMYMCM